MAIFVKLPSGKWIKIKGVMTQVLVSKGRRSVRYVLTGESLNQPPELKSRYRSVSIPSTRVNKVLQILANDYVKEGKGDIVVEPLGREEYVAKCTGEACNDLIKAIKQLDKTYTTTSG